MCRVCTMGVQGGYLPRVCREGVYQEGTYPGMVGGGAYTQGYLSPKVGFGLFSSLLRRVFGLFSSVSRVPGGYFSLFLGSREAISPCFIQSFRE